MPHVSNCSRHPRHILRAGFIVLAAGSWATSAMAQFSTPLTAAPSAATTQVPASTMQRPAETAATPAVPVAVVPAVAVPAAMPVAAASRQSPGIGPVPTQSGRPPAVGDTARHLLSSQADGRAAGAAQPMLGATASLSWKRYVDSFTHPIPEFYESSVGKGEGSTSP